MHANLGHWLIIFFHYASRSSIAGQRIPVLGFKRSQGVSEDMSHFIPSFPLQKQGCLCLTGRNKSNRTPLTPLEEMGVLISIAR